jgi:hypothetical protein
MEEEEKKHRIAYAFYSETWRYKKHSPNQLEEYSSEVTPEEFSNEMRGKIFCPLCATPLYRSPSTTSITKNNRTAHFKHGNKSKYTESKTCGWRTFAGQGLKYDSEEETRQAIENKDLTIVSEWMDAPPSEQSRGDDDSAQYNSTAIEDEDGPETELAIGRRRGEKYKLPSKLSTVMAVCKEFPKNLRRGFYFPNSQFPMLLSDQLYSVENISDILPSKETLFFGEIKEYRRLDYRNIIFLKTELVDKFKIYTEPSFDKRKRIDEKSTGRYILFSAKLYKEKSKVACKVLKWGVQPFATKV